MKYNQAPKAYTLMMSGALATGLLYVNAPIPEYEPTPVRKTTDEYSAIVDDLLTRAPDRAHGNIIAIAEMFDPAQAAEQTPETFVMPRDDAKSAGAKLLEFRPHDPVHKMSNSRFKYFDDPVDKVSFDEVLSATQEFAKQYSVDIMLAECGPDNGIHFEGECIQPRSLETAQNKYNMLEIGYAIAGYPVHLPSDIGLKTITVARGLTHGPENKSIPLAYADNIGGMVLNFDIPVAAHTIHHETSHQINSASASIATVEGIPHFEDIAVLGQYAYRSPIDNKAQNPNGYSKEESDANDIFDKIYALVNSAYYPQTFGVDPKTLLLKAQELRAAEQSKINLVSEYGGTDPDEEFAEIGSELIGINGYSDVLDPASPELRKQSLLFLARMALVSPKSVEAISAANRRKSYRTPEYTNYISNELNTIIRPHTNTHVSLK